MYRCKKRLPRPAVFFLTAALICLTVFTAKAQPDTTFPVIPREDSLLVLPDTLPVDTTVGIVDSGPAEEWAPDPKKALWMSLAVPGLGQIYNRSWWKTPLIYGGLGTSIWFIQFNNGQYRDFKEAYRASFDPETDNELAQRYPNQETLRRIRDIYYKRYQLSIIATAAVYLMNGIEAYVDAHLKNFNVSDDLSLLYGRQDPFPVVLPASGTLAYYPVIGIRYTLH